MCIRDSHMGAYFEMFSRDRSRLKDIRRRMNYCPLGSEMCIRDRCYHIIEGIIAPGLVGAHSGTGQEQKMLRKLWEKCVNYETVSYIICGFLTTAVDFAVYALLRQIEIGVGLSQAIDVYKRQVQTAAITVC